jgi:hypothetical protein
VVYGHRLAELWVVRLNTAGVEGGRQIEKKLLTYVDKQYSGVQGPEVMIFKIFYLEILAKIIVFFAQTTASFCKNI